jgi:hypothetical protein
VVKAVEVGAIAVMSTGPTSISELRGEAVKVMDTDVQVVGVELDSPANSFPILNLLDWKKWSSVLDLKSSDFEPSPFWLFSTPPSDFHITTSRKKYLIF